MPAAADDPWNPGNPYHEEVQFPPQQSFQVTRLDKIGLGPRAKTRAPKWLFTTTSKYKSLSVLLPVKMNN